MLKKIKKFRTETAVQEEIRRHLEECRLLLDALLVSNHNTKNSRRCMRLSEAAKRLSQLYLHKVELAAPPAKAKSCWETPLPPKSAQASA